MSLNLTAGRIAVWDRPGKGLPIVLVHGNSSSKEAFRPLMQTAALADRRLIAIDLPGCGESPDAKDWEQVYTLPGLATTLLEVVRALHLTDYIVMGWSLGGHIAIQALTQGLNPRGLMLTGTPPCGPSPEEIAATFLPVEGSEVMSMERPSREQLMSYLRSVYMPSVPSDALIRDGFRADGRLRKRLFEHLFATPTLPSQRSTVATWTRPIALIQGDREPFFDPRALANLQWANMWRGEIQWINGAGHAPFLDAPDEYARLLEAFARDVETGG